VIPSVGKGDLGAILLGYGDSTDLIREWRYKNKEGGGGGVGRERQGP